MSFISRLQHHTLARLVTRRVLCSSMMSHRGLLGFSLFSSLSLWIIVILSRAECRGQRQTLTSTPNAPLYSVPTGCPGAQHGAVGQSHAKGKKRVWELFMETDQWPCRMSVPHAFVIHRSGSLYPWCYIDFYKTVTLWCHLPLEKFEKKKKDYTLSLKSYRDKNQPGRCNVETENIGNFIYKMQNCGKIHCKLRHMRFLKRFSSYSTS